MYLSGASQDPRMLLPAWVSIASTLTLLYHVAHRHVNIKEETSASLSVFSFTSFISLGSLLIQLHLSRGNDPVIPLFALIHKLWGIIMG